MGKWKNRTPINELSTGNGCDQRHTYRWKRRRAELRAKLAPICVDCGATERLEVDCINGDHFDPNDANFAIRCRKCNMRVAFERGESDRQMQQTRQRHIIDQLRPIRSMTMTRIWAERKAGLRPPRRNRAAHKRIARSKATPIICACGCGRSTSAFNAQGKPRHFIHGHNRRKRKPS